MRLSVATWMAWLTLTMAAAVVSAVSEATPADAESLRFFEKEVRPLLIAKCDECHSTGAKKVRGGLLLDTRAGWQRGGDSGPAIVPGKPDESLLIKAVRYNDSDLRMPPKSKLSDREIEVLVKWVKLGAPDPREAAPASEAIKPRPVDLEQGRRHWAFRPMLDPPVPQVRDATAISPIDRFIVAQLEPAGLSLSPPADKRTLIRRATFDLIGLPPTPAEVDFFLADRSPDAFAKVVDRLLASPRYGERWGRHWLDVARYADSNGLDENVAHGNAWRYRDYVIASFNADKPFDQFVVEQLAGDLMEDTKVSAVAAATPQAAERLTALGFLALGPKVLAEVDKTKMEMDIIDEQIDTIGRSMLGLTLGCVRCHDHKFDPFTMRDYYGLAGIFKSTVTMADFKTIAKWWENPIPSADDLATTAGHDKKIAAKKTEIQATIDQANAALLEKLKAAAPPVSGQPEGPREAPATVKLPDKPEDQYDATTKAALKAQRDELAALEKAKPELASAMGVSEGKPTNLAIHLRGSHLTLGEVVPRQFPVVLAGDKQSPIAADRSGRLELARWIASKENPLTARVIVNRVWRWHLGRGLVRTPDNFGILGQPPTHPELLDWLATRFIEDGWSIKKLHRRIMLSRVYQQSSDHRDDAVKLDPDNRFYSRAPIRRLEAEAIRDSILFVSGRLDLTMGGPAITHVKNREFLFDHTSKDGTKYDSTRRSVYLPVVRNHLYDFFELFDFPDSAVSQGDRPTTTVATQALLAMNSPLIWESAGKMAEELAAGDSDGALRDLYARLLSRSPTSEESGLFGGFMQRAVAAVAGQSADLKKVRKRVWQVYGQAMLGSNEFLYVR